MSQPVIVHHVKFSDKQLGAPEIFWVFFSVTKPNTEGHSVNRNFSTAETIHSLQTDCKSIIGAPKIGEEVFLRNYKKTWRQSVHLVRRDDHLSSEKKHIGSHPTDLQKNSRTKFALMRQFGEDKMLKKRPNPGNVIQPTPQATWDFKCNFCMMFNATISRNDLFNNTMYLCFDEFLRHLAVNDIIETRFSLYLSFEDVTVCNDGVNTYISWNASKILEHRFTAFLISLA